MEELGLRHINVNLSGTQLSDENLAETYIRIMEKYGVDPKYVHLEITESANVERNKTLKNNLDKFLNYGVVFALDDYGTGYSNLNYVVEMPVVTIKFDKQMTDAYFSDAKAKRVMEYSIKMFKSMGLNVVIEGVESKEQLEALSDMMDFEVYDHLIVAKEGIFSFRAKGLITPKERSEDSTGRFDKKKKAKNKELSNKKI